MALIKFYRCLAAVSVMTFFNLGSLWAELSSADAQALKQTQSLLRTKTQRDEAIKKSPVAQEYVHKMDQMGMTSQQKQQAFKVSADVFGQLVQENKGDAAAVQKILQQAQQDPESFYKSLSPENKREIQSLSTEIEAIMSGKPPF